MKTKFYLLGLAAVTLLASSSCKPKQSAYQQVYEVAKAKPIVYAAPADEDRTLIRSTAQQPASRKQQAAKEDVATVKSTATSKSATAAAVAAQTASFQKERITSVDGGAIQRYSVVVGTFINQTNAKGLKEKMQFDGYRPVIAQNGQGMYRVLVATFNDRASAVAEKELIKEKYAPDFEDAWLLEQDF
ncbi:MAG: SPOR domain-containing protein [Candidatus Symbiothrix sp.]|jgi:cell division protein FtsN|nr:SPOR domain-containing protein [Candidatus Symbiothrix sp.]